MSEPENLTPAHLRCTASLACPSIHRLEDGRLLVVGKAFRTIDRADDPTAVEAMLKVHADGKIAWDEEIVLLPSDLLDTLKAEWVREAIRFVLTHAEFYVSSPKEGEVAPQLQEGGSFLVMRPDRVNPGELLPKSYAHREARIQAIGDIAVGVLLPSSEEKKP